MDPLEEAVLAKLRELSPDKQQEVLDFVVTLAARSASAKPVNTVRGLWKDLDIHISAEEIAEARKEMWGNFPREEFFRS